MEWKEGKEILLVTFYNTRCLYLSVWQNSCVVFYNLKTKQKTKIPTTYAFKRKMGNAVTTPLPQYNKLLPLSHHISELEYIKLVYIDSSSIESEPSQVKTFY